MLTAIPFTIVPLVLYDILGIVYGGAPWGNVIFGLPLVSGVAAITLGDLMLILGLIMLFLEILKAALPGPRTIINHLASMGVFVVYLIEFIVLAVAANPTFLILMLMALFDVAAGFTISIRTSSRDISLGRSFDGPM